MKNRRLNTLFSGNRQTLIILFLYSHGAAPVGRQSLILKSKKNKKKDCYKMGPLKLNHHFYLGWISFFFFHRGRREECPRTIFAPMLTRNPMRWLKGRPPLRGLIMAPWSLVPLKRFMWGSDRTDSDSLAQEEAKRGRAPFCLPRILPTWPSRWNHLICKGGVSCMNYMFVRFLFLGGGRGDAVCFRILYFFSSQSATTRAQFKLKLQEIQLQVCQFAPSSVISGM